ncbi:MAG TPA: EFR1 family ferrodoxin [Spirochaetota bacterium]|nr:EFR1 family ferrodoxin [Spirochaetota bacterium]HPF06170.1 EFR1 family ferrodoxin [Spirochaetota bacterium]HPJ42671.1 EFR1 family ferrodoxin [Spirochaetota bacterium]HPR37574.1 EFR1 family ferrodoxin [Spirochaetota bacterium]HRX47657.1 EFR1 family ferrodoxin [Spirochaetota bacterium]
MKKILIAHFSQSGTTAKVAEGISRGLMDKNYAVVNRRIQDWEPIDIDEFDAIGIGFPVYIFRIPFIVKDYIHSLPDLKGKPFFIFMLYGSVRGTAGNMARKLMEKKGGREIGYSYYTGDNIYVGYLKKGYLFSPGHPLKEDLDRAYSFGADLHGILSGEAYNNHPYEPLPCTIFTIERMLTAKPLLKYIYRHFFHVNRKKCTGCGLCIKNCPTGNIKLSRKGFPEFSTRCICCWYCEMKCPAEAITTPIDWPLLNLFSSYNINRTLKEGRTDHVRVNLSGGCIKRID